MRIFVTLPQQSDSGSGREREFVVYTRTGWRIATWDAVTLGGKLIVGVGAGHAQIGLRRGNERHTLCCAGVSGGLGVGVGDSYRDINIPGGPLGFNASIRTSGGTLYKNNLVIPGELTLDDLRTSWVVAQGGELTVLDEGQAGYLVMFASNLGSFGPLLGGGGLLTAALSAVGCKALTWLSVEQQGLPNVGLSGYRYRITSVT